MRLIKALMLLFQYLHPLHPFSFSLSRRTDHLWDCISDYCVLGDASYRVAKLQLLKSVAGRRVLALEVLDGS